MNGESLHCMSSLENAVRQSSPGKLRCAREENVGTPVQVWSFGPISVNRRALLEYGAKKGKENVHKQVEGARRWNVAVMNRRLGALAPVCNNTSDTANQNDDDDKNIGTCGKAMPGSNSKEKTTTAPTTSTVAENTSTTSASQNSYENGSLGQSTEYAKEETTTAADASTVTACTKAANVIVKARSVPVGDFDHDAYFAAKGPYYLKERRRTIDIMQERLRALEEKTLKGKTTTRDWQGRG
jgi:hypothetical protein